MFTINKHDYLQYEKREKKNLKVIIFWIYYGIIIELYIQYNLKKERGPKKNCNDSKWPHLVVGGRVVAKERMALCSLARSCWGHSCSWAWPDSWVRVPIWREELMRAPIVLQWLIY